MAPAVAMGIPESGFKRKDSVSEVFDNGHVTSLQCTLEEGL